MAGNPGKRAANKREPKPKKHADPPVAPEHLDDDARRAWDTLAPMLVRLGVLTEADHFALERLAECYSEVREHRAELKEIGHTYETVSATGGVMHRRRPEAVLLADADRRFKGYLVEFGLTPAARSKVESNSDGGEEDPAEGYFGA